MARSVSGKPTPFIFLEDADARLIAVARLDVHLENRLGMPGWNQALPELEEQARQAGAEAIIEIEETRRWYGEVGIYHVTATGIRFED